MIRGVLAAGAVVVAVAFALPWADRTSAQSTQVPVFELDAKWPKLPNNWVLGQTPGVAVDRHDHIWVLHRPLRYYVQGTFAGLTGNCDASPSGGCLQKWVKR